MAERGSTPAMAMQAQPQDSTAESTVGTGEPTARQRSGKHAKSRGYPGEFEKRFGSQLDLYCSQKRQRQTQTGHQSEMDQQPPKRKKIQNDHHERRQGVDNQGMLDGQDRSKRLLLASSRDQEGPEVPGILVAEKSMCSSAFRSE